MITEPPIAVEILPASPSKLTSYLLFKIRVKKMLVNGAFTSVNLPETRSKFTTFLKYAFYQQKEAGN